MHTINESDVDLIRESEEAKYYPVLMEMVAHSVKYPTLRNEEERLLEELEIIHKMCESKTIIFCHRLVEEAKFNNEPFLISSPIAGLYLLYVLEMIKGNPIENGCCYQACLGIKDNPNSTIGFGMLFRDEYVEQIRNFAMEMDSNSTCYHFSFDEESMTYNKTYMILVPNVIDVEKYCIVKNIEDDIPVLGMKGSSSFKIGVDFSITSWPIISVVDEMDNKYGSTGVDEALSDYIHAVSDKSFSRAFYTKLAEKVPLETYKDAINFEGFCHSYLVNKDGVCRFVFPDRDSVFFYLVNDANLSEKSAYKIMEETKTGTFRKKHHDDNITDAIGKKELDALNNIKYLFSRGHAAEFFYWRLKAAHYFRYHRNEYLELMKKYDVLGDIENV